MFSTNFILQLSILLLLAIIVGILTISVFTQKNCEELFIKDLTSLKYPILLVVGSFFGFFCGFNLC